MHAGAQREADPDEEGNQDSGDDPGDNGGPGRGKKSGPHHPDPPPHIFNRLLDIERRLGKIEGQLDMLVRHVYRDK